MENIKSDVNSRIITDGRITDFRMDTIPITACTILHLSFYGLRKKKVIASRSVSLRRRALRVGLPRRVLDFHPRTSPALDFQELLVSTRARYPLFS